MVTKNLILIERKSVKVVLDGQEITSEFFTGFNWFNFRTGDAVYMDDLNHYRRQESKSPVEWSKAYFVTYDVGDDARVPCVYLTSYGVDGNSRVNKVKVRTAAWLAWSAQVNVNYHDGGMSEEAAEAAAGPEPEKWAYVIG